MRGGPGNRTYDLFRTVSRYDRRPLARLRRPSPPLRGGPVFDEYVGPNWTSITILSECNFLRVSALRDGTFWEGDENPP